VLLELLVRRDERGNWRRVREQEQGKTIKSSGFLKLESSAHGLDIWKYLKDVKVPTLILAPNKSTAAAIEQEDYAVRSNHRDEQLIHDSTQGSIGVD
jgi:hypothetical protein